MKRMITIFSVFVMIIGVILFNYSYAYEKTYTLEFKASDVSEDFDLYLLLPKDYILFAIEEDGLNIEYTGVETLKSNDIPSIRVDKESISDELYEEGGVKYIQILLQENEKGKYEFDILSNYNKMNMKYRVKNMNKDDIVHIDNFKISNGVCKVEYNYEKNTIEQHISNFVTILVIILIFILIMIIVLGIISYIKQRKDRRE